MADHSTAFGSPGIPPHWTRGAKDAVGTAYAASSRVWFTMAQGTLTEIYYPTIDTPQVRDLQFLFTDGATFFYGERRDCDSHSEVLAPYALGYRVTSSDRRGRFTCRKEIIADPHLSCVLLHTRLEMDPGIARSLRMFVLCAPHLDGIGGHNSAEVSESAGRVILQAHRDGTWLAIASTSGLLNPSAGYVGASDGWTDLAEHFQPTFHFDRAPDGNVALCAEIALPRAGAHHSAHAESGPRVCYDFTLGLAFGPSRHAAVNTVLQSLDEPFSSARDRFVEQWDRTGGERRLPLERYAQDGGELYHRSVSLLLSHEDKSYPGAMIAALSIPWGEVKGDEDLGGYHLVWTRDLVHSATALLASGDPATARRALIYLAASQNSDGGFAQNFWLDGTAYWRGIQLDEVAFPILLAWRLHAHHGLEGFDPFPMVRRAAGYLMANGPATQEERWEEAGGYSPSSLAAHIAGLVCAADLARQHNDTELARMALEYADFLEAHLEAWTVTAQSSLVPGIRRHYIRINPAPLANFAAEEDPDSAVLHINNRAPGERSEFPANEIVDAGFLELVRYGIRAADDPLIQDSLRVVDAALKCDTPFGPAWRRYNHDGYGQRADGSAFAGWGQGRPWPLLTGERAHYQLAAGDAPNALAAAMERFANGLNLLPEQVWDQPDVPSQFLYFGRPTGSAMPLMWAHAEYICLLRSMADGVVFDLLPPVAERYQKKRGAPSRWEMWKYSQRRVSRVAAGTRLRIQAPAEFVLHGSHDNWATIIDLASTPTSFGFAYVDVDLNATLSGRFRFTFRYSDGHWEGRDFEVAIAD